MRQSRIIPAVGFGALVAFGFALVRGESDTARSIEFNRQIRPIFSEHCFKCHGFDPGSRQAGLRLDLPEGATAALKSGKIAIVPGEPDKSELLRRVGSSDPTVRMPPPEADNDLNVDQIELLEQWIKEGATWKKHWSLIPPVRPNVPVGRSGHVLRNPIDHFIADRLAREGMDLSPPADKATLIRRVTLDLTGLPPTLAEVDAFLADTAEDGYEKLVRRLLDSPRYGEHMARRWLDAARYADTNGRHHDDIRTLWPWRDWVINAFNDDMSFDRFALEQVAGDMLAQATVDHQVASGFNRNHTTSHEGGAIPDELRVLYVADRVITTSTVFMGLTMGCAQCHDHKYDPVTQAEFYQFFAFFNNVPEKGLDGRIGNSRPLLRLPTSDQEIRLSELDSQIVDLEQRIKARETALAATGATSTTEATGPGNAQDQKQATEDPPVPDDEQHKQLVARRDELNKQRQEVDKAVLTTMVMREMGKRRQTHLLIRGQYDQHGEPVSPGVPAALGGLSEGAPADRLSLARWLVGPSHPLTARVTVNRFWQHYFGAGIVKTAEDFGTQGQWPSHPELLDWLARRFIDGGWDIKAMQYLIVTSTTYRQSSRTTSEQLQQDRENRLLGRGPRFRLPAEMIRDTALAVGGLLVEKVGGPSVRPYQPPGLWRAVSIYPDEQGMGFQAQVFEQDHGAGLYRRSMYTFWKRTSPPPSMIAFDAPNRETCIVRRTRTNTPMQALVLMNDPQFIEAARAMAQRMIKGGGPDPHDRISFGFRLATARHPSVAEISLLNRLQKLQLEEFQAAPDRAAAFLAVGDSPHDDTLDAAELAAWTMVASTILNLDETITKE